MQVNLRGRIQNCRTVTFDRTNNVVEMIDQRLLPHAFSIYPSKDYRQTARAIRDMVVRGAGAIGATAAYGLAQGLQRFRGADVSSFLTHAEKVFTTLKEARPTAVDPVNAMKDVLHAMDAEESVLEKKRLAIEAAGRFAGEDVEHCAAIGRHGARLIRNGMRVLTHCNAGWLAFVDIGSATAPMYVAREQGKEIFVYVDETRPRCQGSRLTAFELGEEK